MKTFSNIKLKNYTTFQIGGVAKTLIEVSNYDELLTVCNQSYKDPKIILGGGSNVLVSDNGFDGIVIVSKGGNIELKDNYLIVDSGVLLAKVSKFCCDHDLAGYEWACSLPGSVGGCVKMNAGAFGTTIADCLVWVDILRNGKVLRLDNNMCGFSYRSSKLLNGDIVLRACFSCASGNKLDIAQLRKKYLEFRKNTQPSGPSAGSIFKGAEKPAGWYIDNAGLKGAICGGAKISTLHANFIINTGFAKASDVVSLIELIKYEVKSKYNVDLQEEIKYIGNF